MAAAQGNVDAQANLGWMYDNGDGVPKDTEEALKWFRKAADRGNVVAQRNLGVMYFNGDGVAKDNAEALKWYRRAAEQGNANAESDLGFMYVNGDGVPKDSAEAAKWLRKAADQGNALAQAKLGWLYANGEGVPKDSAEAAHWYRKGAEQGNADAQYNLGVLYANGDGVSRNSDEAAKWLQKAAKHDNLPKLSGPPVIDARLRVNVDAMPINGTSLEFYLSPLVLASGQRPTVGTIYPLAFLRVVQKVESGYLMRFESPMGDSETAELVFVKTSTEFPENYHFMDTAHFGVYVGPFQYQAVDGFNRSIYQFDMFSDEANGWVLERLHQKPSTKGFPAN
jgi:TPR repeat protein